MKDRVNRTRTNTCRFLLIVHLCVAVSTMAQAGTALLEDVELDDIWAICVFSEQDHIRNSVRKTLLKNCGKVRRIHVPEEIPAMGPMTKAVVVLKSKECIILSLYGKSSLMDTRMDGNGGFLRLTNGQWPEWAKAHGDKKERGNTGNVQQ